VLDAAARVLDAAAVASDPARRRCVDNTDIAGTAFEVMR